MEYDLGKSLKGPVAGGGMKNWVWVVLGRFDKLIHIEVYTTEEKAESRKKFLQELLWKVDIQKKELF